MTCPRCSQPIAVWCDLKVEMIKACCANPDCKLYKFPPEEGNSTKEATEKWLEKVKKVGVGK